MTTEEEDKELVDMEEQLLFMHGDLLHQLMSFDRFKIFMEANYDVQLVRNEEEKTVKFVVMQRTPEQAAEHMMALAQELQKQSPGVQIFDASTLDMLEGLKNGK